MQLISISYLQLGPHTASLVEQFHCCWLFKNS